MFALWRSRLAQSGVGDHGAADSLIFALQAIPQLAHVADRCKDMLGRIPLAFPCNLGCGVGFLAHASNDSNLSNEIYKNVSDKFPGQSTERTTSEV